MSSSNFEEYLSKVTSKVKYKVAHGMIKKELSNHMEELSQSFQKRGLSKKDADIKAIQEMGDPFTIGKNMNHLHKPKMDWLLIVLFVILAGISFLPLIGGVSVPSFSFIKNQIVWLLLAILALIGFLFFDYRKLKNLWMYFYGGGLILFFTTLLAGIDLNGVKRWISLGGIAIDAPAISLFLFVIAWAGIFAKVNEFKGWKKQGMLLFLFWTPVLLSTMLPQFMFSIIYFFCVLAMYVFSYVHKQFAIKVAMGNLLIGIIFIRTMILKFPNSYLSDTLIPLKDNLSEAGWFGKGLYNDLNLPEAHTDFVFPFLVHSLGWAFGIILCLLLFVFILRISLNAFKTKDLFGRLLAIGGAALFIVPACWNILMGFGIVPIMVVPLPFISYGGSILLVYSALLGLFLNVYRRKDIVEPTMVN
ncbi:FtsW/RodA/SpoVE family cell cycle protein [Metabacillus halosaccharovorans]|uniref:FtsW/RodA/SpoVE family cell cycle protein n=1 Tax=Metabacillus halosaccharovorans TaxID=930124 RepID=UPI001C1F3C0D|nr:FtsW/RodA/SpoVE family cell cycle protein [Metabacillus halosaccharovorans]MBU7591171.1 FtsW/RodA/SpoVE family cell cycle protein [Metabacillus halosaccharovorans]